LGIGARPSLLHTFVNPGRPIPPAATLIHGITEAHVADQPPFRQIARKVYQFLKGCDLAGFNITGFDLTLLVAALARVNCRLRLRGRSVVDVLDIYRRMEPHDLTSAVRYYLGREHADGHSARADVLATAQVLDAQIGHYGLPRTAAGLHAHLVEVDVARRFRRDNLGQIAFNFGKYVGRSLTEVATTDPGYLEWMLCQPFLEDVHILVRSALSGNSLACPDEG
jgi:DNA polymerase-3 subunit epsilon